MIDKAAISNPTTHYGTPGSGTRSFILQRASGALNVLFLIFFAWFVIRLAGAARDDMVEVVRNPFVAIVMALLIVNVCLHMRNGMRDVIDDYVAEGPRFRLANAANTLFVAVIGLAGLGALIKIVFWG